MKYYIKSFLAVAIAIGLTACENDWDKVYITSPEPAEMTTTTTNVQLNRNNPDAVALTINWSDNGNLSFSDPSLGKPGNVISNYIQMSRTEDFAKYYQEPTEKGQYSRTWTNEELNTSLLNLGYEPFVESQLYIRVMSQLGNNDLSAYSAPLMLTVVPYVVEAVLGYLYETDFTPTGKAIVSPFNDGVYQGFVNVESSYWNWVFREENGKFWANTAVSGSAFHLTDNEGNYYNMWYPTWIGCYWTVMNTVEYLWSALYVNEIALTGDVVGTMEYDLENNRWTYAYNAANAGNISLTVKGTGLQYNVETGTSSSKGISTGFAFSGTADELIFGEDASSISVAVPGTGARTIILDFSNPLCYTLRVE